MDFTTLKGLSNIPKAMPQSLSAIYLHTVFSTKNRHPFLSDESLRKEVFAYIGGICKTFDCQPVAIGGWEDHAHVLVRFGKEVTVSGFIKEVKRKSSVFAKELMPAFSWQAGYAVFSVDASGLDNAARYVRNQEEHHRGVGFQDELRALMTEHGIEWDERYFWD